MSSEETTIAPDSTVEGPTAEDRAWRDVYQAGMSAGSDACPDDETLAALVMGEFDEERHGLALHVTQCTRCAASYRTLRELDRGAGGPRLATGRRPWVAAAAAAVVIVAAGVGLWVSDWQPGSMTSSAVRGGPESAQVHPADRSILAAVSEFSWPDQSGAMSYRVRLYDEAAELIWESPTVEVPATPGPRAEEADLTAGHSYFWTVEAEGTVTRSLQGPYWFSVEQ